MPPLVAPGVCRFTLHGTVGDRPWANIWDMHIQSGSISNRSTNIANQGQVLLNEWIDHIRPLVSTATKLEGVRWLDLDTLQGTVGERTDAESPRVMPSQGALASPAAANIALLVSKVGPTSRGARPGRSFIAGLAEAHTEVQTLNAGNLAAWTTAFNEFLSGINQSDASDLRGYDSHLVVVHTVGGVVTGHDDVNALSVNTRLATQRRRLRA